MLLPRSNERHENEYVAAIPSSYGADLSHSIDYMPD